MHAMVIGAGIGGLSAAIGLRRAGWSVSVYERAAALGEVGAGLSLWPNALRALRSLGLADQVAALSRPQRSGGIRRPDGSWLSRWEGPMIEDRLGDPLVGVHRARLHEALRAALPAGSIHCGRQIDRIAGDEADLIVAADGIDSRIRRQFFPSHPAPVYSGMTAWRGVCDPPGDVDVAITWGRGEEAGILPLTDGRVYWYYSLKAPPKEKAGLDRIRTWHDPFPRLLEATPRESILHHDLYYLPGRLPSYVSGRVALLGDAAHAMTPSLGQGACQAIEDAAGLMSAAARYGDDVPRLLAEYDTNRRPRSQSVAAQSLRVGRYTSGISNPVLASLRDAVVRLTPTGLSLRGMTAVGDWSPPTIPDRTAV